LLFVFWARSGAAREASLACGARFILLWFLANPFRIRFSLVRRLIEILPNLGNILVFISWLYIDDEALPIGRADNPPTGQSRVGTSKN